MLTHEIVIRVPLLPAARLALLVGLLTALPRVSSTSDVSTLASYYPTPTGAFESDDDQVNSLVATGDAWIARDAGHVELGTVENNNVRVSIGAGPKLPAWCEASPGAPGCQQAHLTVTGPANPTWLGAVKIDGCIRLRNTGVNGPAYRCHWPSTRTIAPEFAP